jgi:hypothetical protein
MTKTLAPEFRQRLQWQVPIILGGSVSSKRTDWQQQLPLIMTAPFGATGER